MLSALPEMIVDVVHARVAPLRVPDFLGQFEIAFVAIGVGYDWPFGIWHTDAKEAAALQNPKRLGKKHARLQGVFQMLKEMLAVDHRGGAVAEWQREPQIEMEVRFGIKQVDIDPSRL